MHFVISRLCLWPKIFTADKNIKEIKQTIQIIKVKKQLFYSKGVIIELMAEKDSGILFSEKGFNLFFFCVDKSHRQCKELHTYSKKKFHHIKKID